MVEFLSHAGVLRGFLTAGMANLRRLELYGMNGYGLLAEDEDRKFCDPDGTIHSLG